MRGRPLVLLATIGVLHSSPVGAKSTKTFTYAYNAVWTTAVRLIRADRSYKITDRDKESGYILFVYPGTGSVKECAASLEMIAVLDRYENKLVRVQLQIAHQPSYNEIHLLDLLERKLLDERGEPPPRRMKKKEPPKKPKKPQKPAPPQKDR